MSKRVEIPIKKYPNPNDISYHVDCFGHDARKALRIIAGGYHFWATAMPTSGGEKLEIFDTKTATCVASEIATRRNGEPVFEAFGRMINKFWSKEF